MKRFPLLLAALAFALLSLTSCNSGPDGVAKKWLTAYYHKDYNGAKAFSTLETQEQLDALIQLDTDTAHVALDSARKLTVNVRSTKQLNDSTADVTYTVSDAPASEQHLKLVKNDGKWLVAWSKLDGAANSFQGEMEPMPRTPDPGTIDAGDADSLDVAPQADPIDTSNGNLMQ